MIYISVVTILYLLFVYRLQDRRLGYTTRRAWPLLVVAATIHLAFFCTQKYVLAHHMTSASTYMRVYPLKKGKDGREIPFIISRCRIDPDTTLRYAMWVEDPVRGPVLTGVSESAEFVREAIAPQDACLETSWDTLAFSGRKRTAAWLLLNIAGKYNRRTVVHLPEWVRVDSVRITQTDSTTQLYHLPCKQRTLLSSLQ